MTTDPHTARREQLPERILTQIRPYLLPYVSTACQTAKAVAEHLADLAQADMATSTREWTMRRKLLHKRCRKNQKFTGQPCDCPCHEEQETQQTQTDTQTVPACNGCGLQAHPYLNCDQAQQAREADRG